MGIAYTLQVVAQRNAHPAHASIILSMEGVFAVLAGWLILKETLGARGLLGCSLMLTGMLVSQLWIHILPQWSPEMRGLLTGSGPGGPESKT